MKKLVTTVSLILVLICFKCNAQNVYKPVWESIDSRPIPPWFENAKFGIFIHWGVFSVPSYSPTVRDNVGVYDRYAEWYWSKLVNKSKVQQYFIDYHNKMYGQNFKYQDFANQFKAELFNPVEWAERFKQAGAQYVVLTAKHHDGFTLWPSPQSWNWNAYDIGPHRDLCGDLGNAVKSKGLHMGFYYSLYEWFNPLYKSDFSKYVDDHMMPQLKELVNNYQPDILWTDGEWEQPSYSWKSTQFLSWLYNESPVKNSIVVNDRWGKETRSKHGGFYTTEYDLVDNKNAKGSSFVHPWEECRGIAGSFGYNRNEQLEDYSSSEELVHILINKVCLGGNLLLNVGPTADGRIPEIQQQRLADIGTWLKVNGEAIYNTRKWEKSPSIKPETTRYFTKNGDNLYLIVTKWQDSPIVLEGISNVDSVSMLGFKSKISFSFSEKRLSITPPSMSPVNIPCQYAWVFKITNGAKDSN